jgi:thiol:disulfide interchange protein DsbD
MSSILASATAGTYPSSLDSATDCNRELAESRKPRYGTMVAMRRSMRAAVRPSTLAIAAAALVLLVPAIAGADDGGFTDAQARGWVWVLLGAFGAGFATSLTPCVYPMIGITLAIFGARGKDVTKGRALALATAYVLGMGVTYTVLGVTFATIGKSFGTQLGSAYVVIPIALLFVVLALSMFGLYELNLPASWQARLNQVGGKGFGGAFAMGTVGGLIAAPCTGPFLAGILLYVSTTGDVVFGGLTLFTFAIGMGILFWVLAAVAQSLPKGGPWMDRVKSAAGTALLFAAIYYLRIYFPRGLKNAASPELWFLAFAVAVAIAGLAVGALRLSFHGERGEKLRKAAGVALLLVGSLGVWRWWEAPKQHVPWVTDERVAFERARAEHKGVMVDFTADWCQACHDMEKVFGESDVYTTIVDNFVPLQLDVTADDEGCQHLRERFRATGAMPAIAFWSSGDEAQRAFIGGVSGEKDADDFIDILTPFVKQLRARGASPTALQ